MKTKLPQTARNIQRVARLAEKQNKQFDTLWLIRSADALQQAIQIIQKRAKVLGFSLPHPGEETGPAMSAAARFFFLRSTFWSAQAALTSALFANKELSEEAMSDLGMAKTMLAQQLHFDFRAIGMAARPPNFAEMHRQVGGLIAAKRKEKGLTQAALGESVGLTPQSITRIEGGKQRIAIVALYGIARTLGIPVEELIPLEILFCAEQFTEDEVHMYKTAALNFVRDLERREKELKRKSKHSGKK